MAAGPHPKSQINFRPDETMAGPYLFEDKPNVTVSAMLRPGNSVN